MKIRRIGVLGGTGYLGKLLIKKLVQENWDVLLLHRTSSDIAKLQRYLGEDARNVTAVNIELENIEFDKVDCVINLACIYEKKGFDLLPIVKSNLMTPLRILHHAVESGVPKFISIGTGLPDTFNAYALSKSQLKQWGQYFACNESIQFVNVSLESFYGYEEPAERFLPSIIQKMRKNEKIELTLGQQCRDWIFIDDVINVLMLIIDAEYEPFYKEISVGTGVSPTIREFVEYIHQELSSESELCFGAVELRRNEPSCVANIEEIKKLGYTMQYDWKTGIKKIIDG